MFSAKIYRDRAWQSLKGKYVNYLASMFIYFFIVSAISGFVFLKIPDEGILRYIIPSVIVFLNIIISYPIMVGLAYQYLKGRTNMPKISDMFNGFKNNPGKVTFIMFLTNLKIYLWSLLFIIPGIIKGYEYSMIPFILAENPDIGINEAFKLTRKLTYGNKFNIFILFFSYIGWILLGLLTFGIGYIFVLPYMMAGITEFYCDLKAKTEA